MKPSEKVDRVLQAAATGSVAAQAAMLDRAIGVLHENDRLTTDMLASVEWWARILAAHQQPEHVERLAGVLLFMSAIHRHAGSAELAAKTAEEGFVLLRDQVNRGSASAGSLLSELSSIVARDAVVSASVTLGSGPLSRC